MPSKRNREIDAPHRGFQRFPQKRETKSSTQKAVLRHAKKAKKHSAEQKAMTKPRRIQRKEMHGVRLFHDKTPISKQLNNKTRTRSRGLGGAKKKAQSAHKRAVGSAMRGRAERIGINVGSAQKHGMKFSSRRK